MSQNMRPFNKRTLLGKWGVFWKQQFVAPSYSGSYAGDSLDGAVS